MSPLLTPCMTSSFPTDRLLNTQTAMSRNVSIATSSRRPQTIPQLDHVLPYELVVFFRSFQGLEGAICCGVMAVGGRYRPHGHGVGAGVKCRGRSGWRAVVGRGPRVQLSHSESTISVFCDMWEPRRFYAVITLAEGCSVSPLHWELCQQRVQYPV